MSTPTFKCIARSLIAGFVLTAIFFGSLMAGDRNLLQWSEVPVSAMTEDGLARVIVELHVPNFDALARASAISVSSPVDFRTAQKNGISTMSAADTALKMAIEKTTLDVLATLPEWSYRVNRQYRFLPFVAMEVTPEALLELQWDQHIKSIYSNVPIPLPDIDFIENGNAEKGSSDFETDSVEPHLNIPSMADTISLIGADRTWAQGYTGLGWYVAILDSGIRQTHEFFEGKNIVEACFSNANHCPNNQSEMFGAGSAAHHSSTYQGYDHGTHVAGTAAGRSPSGELFGVAKDSDIIAVNVFSRFTAAQCDGSPCIRAYTSDVLAGLEYIYGLRNDYNIGAVNMSLGEGRHSTACNTDSRKAATDLLRAANIPTAAATGNNYYCGSINAPACISSVLAVMASSKTDRDNSFSNWHASLADIFAPGASIRSATGDSDTSYGNWNGTSMATPHVSGGLTLLRQYRPQDSPAAHLTRLTERGPSITTFCSGGGSQKRIHLGFMPHSSSHAVFVTPDGSGDGSSWENAMGDVQFAIEFASEYAHITEVWVAAGTYLPTSRPNRTGTESRDVHFSLKNGVAVYGGFAGHESDLQERDFVANRTILSGDIGLPNDNSDNAYNVFYHPEGIGLNHTARLDGFVISDSNASSWGGRGSGGGIYNHSNSPTLSNLTIINNTASGDGAGVYNHSSSPVLTHVAISNNRGSNGGGLYNRNSNPILTHVEVFNNQSTGSGGGLYNHSGDPVLTHVTIRDNTSNSRGGGVYNTSFSTPNLSSVTISGNRASTGGGIYNDSSSIILTNVTISGNQSSGSGAGIYNGSFSDAILTNVTIADNRAGGSFARGGGIYNADSSPVIKNCILWGNTDRDGDQIYNAGLSAPKVSWSLIQHGYPNGNHIISDDPLLEPLSPNGGHTETHALSNTSPAYGIPQSAGSGNWNAAPDTDQRSEPRALTGVRAMGSFEAERQRGNLSVTINQEASDAGAQWRRADSNQCGILGECLDNTDIAWTTGGHANWFCQTEVSHHGGISAQSGRINHNHNSWLSTSVIGPGRITFHWKVSSEYNNDFLSFYIGNTRQERISGAVDWSEVSIDVPPGSQTLKWVYSKDSSVNSGDDAGWVDLVVWSGDQTGLIEWFNSGFTEMDVLAGEHEVVFKNIDGWTTPDRLTVTVTADETTTATGTYSLNSYTVTGTAGSGGSISPASRTVNHGATTTFTVTPNTGYSIATVTGCSGSLSGNTYTTGAITGACTVNATFSLNTYIVTGTAGEGGSISPATRTVNHGATTTFTVTPNTGYGIAAVTGCGGTLSGNTYTTGSITGACTVSATFSLNSYTITGTAGSGGSISPASRTVNHGATTTFTVTPNTGYGIAAVTGCGGTLSGNTYTTGAITGACTVNASFSLNSYTVTGTAGSGGSISPASRTVNHGATTTFTVTPNTGYGIAAVTGCGGTLSGNTYTTGSITGACTVNASFSLNSYTVTGTAGAGGSISPASRTVNHGATTTFTVTPNTGYGIATVTGCNGTLSGNTYTTGAITGACTVNATFSLNSYTVTGTAGAGGSVDPASHTVNHGSAVSFSVNPDTGYTQSTLGGTCPGGAFSGNTYTTGAIVADCIVIFTFSQYGSLRILIEPSAARAAGAQWRRAGTTVWRNSGDVEARVPVGNHSIQFRSVRGWKPREALTVNIQPGTEATATGEYVEREAVNALPGVMMLLLDD